MVEVVGTEEFEDWYMGLSERDAEGVTRVVGLLEQKGVALGYPYGSGIKGSKILRELRIQSGGRALRVFYAFDPLRRAALLLGGNKTGDDRFYTKFIPRAEKLWVEYLTTVVREERRK
jgi:hypothetical protein